MNEMGGKKQVRRQIKNSQMSCFLSKTDIADLICGFDKC